MSNNPFSCPYCKISFIEEPWARGNSNCVCINCKRYAEALSSKMEKCLAPLLDGETDELVKMKAYFAIHI